MKMFLAILFVLGGCSAYDLEVREKGMKFKEKITFLKNGCQRLETPKHFSNLPASVVHCFGDVKYTFANVVDGDKKICYIHPLSKDVHSLQKRRDLILSRFKLPKNGKRLVHKWVPGSCEEELDNLKLAELIEEHCMKGYSKVCVSELKENETVEKRAVAMLKRETDNKKRGVMLREFLACTQSEYGNLLGYINKCGMDKINAKCKMQRHYCTYELICPMNQETGFWNCKYNHLFDEISCCDFHC